jgi:hypothetical protein
VIVINILHDVFDVVSLLDTYWAHAFMEGFWFGRSGTLFGTERSLKKFVMKPSIKSVMTSAGL